jgi:hypothetical protein
LFVHGLSDQAWHPRSISSAANSSLSSIRDPLFISQYRNGSSAVRHMTQPMP